ncbi:hypothetical protein ACJX0J_037530 [Zea mays]
MTALLYKMAILSYYRGRSRSYRLYERQITAVQEKSIKQKSSDKEQNEIHRGYMTIDTDKGLDENKIIMFYADDYKILYEDFKLIKEARSARTCLFDGLFILRGLDDYLSYLKQDIMLLGARASLDGKIILG